MRWSHSDIRARRSTWYPGQLYCSLLRSRSCRSHVTLPVPTRLLQTDIHSFLGVLRFCLLGPMSLSFSCHCVRYTNHRREHSQENESHTLIGLFPRKECMSVWSSRLGTGSVTWLQPERLRRRQGQLQTENRTIEQLKNGAKKLKLKFSLYDKARFKSVESDCERLYTELLFKSK